MNVASLHHRLPRAGVDRITSPETALLMLAMTAHRPLRPETIAILLDDQRRGVAVAVVSDTRRPDDVLEVVECLTQTSAHGGRVGGIIVASVRPGYALDAPPHPGDTRDDDVDRWLELSDITEQVGVELLEWFVIGDDVTCPRDHLGEPPRW